MFTSPEATLCHHTKLGWNQSRVLGRDGHIKTQKNRNIKIYLQWKCVKKDHIQSIYSLYTDTSSTVTLSALPFLTASLANLLHATSNLISSKVLLLPSGTCIELSCQVINTLSDTCSEECIYIESIHTCSTHKIKSIAWSGL